MKEETLNEKERNALKGISKLLYVLAAIGKICSAILIPFVILAMVALFVVFNKIEYRDNSLLFDNDKIITIKEENDEITIETSETISSFIKINNEDKDDVLEIKKFLEENSKGLLLAYAEINLLALTIILFISCILCQKIMCFFKNIHEGNTPFTEENTLLIRNIITLIICAMGVSVIANIIVMIITSVNGNLSFDFDFDFDDFYAVLVMMVMYYVFKYGTALQSKSKMNIYAEGKK